MASQTIPTAIDRLLAVLGGDPFADFPFRDHTSDLQGWVDEGSILFDAIEKLQPEVIVEVGTWKGSSAIAMAKRMKMLNLPGRVV
ncbi:MAG: hypothetical protein EXQ92_02990 [Alphaproteobacteria bacterium]|nr:hypothetical protein [Alphaproteobacteria bacterium]